MDYAVFVQASKISKLLGLKSCDEAWRSLPSDGYWKSTFWHVEGEEDGLNKHFLPGDSFSVLCETRSQCWIFTGYALIVC